MSNPQDKTISIQEFYGGRSSDAAIGPAASFSYDRALEFRRNPSQLTVLPGPRKISGGVVQDLILNVVQVKSGNRYAFGDQGFVYKIDTNNVVTYVNKLSSGSDGLVYRNDNDTLYFATQTEVVRYTGQLATPAFDVTYGPSRSADTNAYRTGGASTYTVPITLTESDYCSFQPDIEPFYSIKVFIPTKGTGNWTLTLHDGLNTSLATSTLTNANITAGQLNEFVFSSQVRALVKPNARTYHYHLTSTVADGTVTTSTSGNLNTADFQLWAYRLVDTVNNLHPMAQFQQFILIGNGNYLSVWEPLTDSDPPNNEFQRHRLTFPTGFEVCGIAVTDEFAVIACEKRSTDGTKDFQEGKLFTWDGTAQTYNQVIDVSGGSPEAIYTNDNYPYFIVNNALCAWPGGKNIVTVRTLANTDTAYRDAVENTTVYPNMMTIRDNLLHLGFPSSTTNTAIEHGVYTWGSLEKNYPASFGYGYVASSMQDENTDPNGDKKLGCVRNFGDEMYMSWKDGSSYGLDIVDSYCNPAPVFKFRARRFDAGMVRKDKQAKKMAIDTAALPAGVEITPVHSINGATDVTHDPMTENATEKIVAIQSGTFKRITYGFSGTSTGTATPTIYADTLDWDPLITRKPV
ncbi:MAG: hypothetical protein ABIR46_03155 [Candidatus Saccharimonadales bacterium]